MAESDRLVRTLRAYVHDWSHQNVTSFLTSWGTGRQRGLIVGEWHFGPAGQSSLELIEALATTGRFTYWATEWFFPRTPAEAFRLIFRFAPVLLSPDKIRVVEHRYSPVLALARRLQKHGLPISGIGTAAQGLARNAVIASHLKDAVQARSDLQGAVGLVQVGAAHASRVSWYGKESTTAQIVENAGWSLSSVCVVRDQMFRPLGRDEELSLRSLRRSTGREAIPLRPPPPLKAETGPFHRIAFSERQSGRSIAEQFDYLVLT